MISNIKYMAPNDFKHKDKRWKEVIKVIDRQIQVIDEEIDSLIAADPVLNRQKELLKSIDGVGERIAINMIAITGGFTRFRNARQFCSFAGLSPYKYDSGSSVFCPLQGKDFQTVESDDEDLAAYECGKYCDKYGRRIQGVLRTQTERR